MTDYSTPAQLDKSGAVAEMSQDAELIARTAAVMVEQGVVAGGQNPIGDAMGWAWWLWATPGHEDASSAWISARAAGNPSPGDDPAVVTEIMILTYVQAPGGPMGPNGATQEQRDTSRAATLARLAALEGLWTAGARDHADDLP